MQKISILAMLICFSPNVFGEIIIIAPKCSEELYMTTVIRTLSVQVIETLCLFAPKDIHGKVRPECGGPPRKVIPFPMGIRG